MIVMLTDGVQYFEFEVMEEGEYLRENERALEESGGNVFWLELEENQILDLLKRLISYQKIEGGIL